MPMYTRENAVRAVRSARVSGSSDMGVFKITASRPDPSDTSLQPLQWMSVIHRNNGSQSGIMSDVSAVVGYLTQEGAMLEAPIDQALDSLDSRIATSVGETRSRIDTQDLQPRTTKKRAV